MSVTPDSAADQRLSVGVPVYFCSSKCADEYDARDRAHKTPRQSHRTKVTKNFLAY